MLNRAKLETYFFYYFIDDLRAMFKKAHAEKGENGGEESYYVKQPSTFMISHRIGLTIRNATE